MIAVDVNTTVGQLVAERPARARTFERFGIDYCCGGKTPLQEACAQAGAELPEVLNALEQADAAPAADETDWSKRSVSELADHIEATHHAYLRREMPRLTDMLAKVVEVHGARHSELAELQDVFAGLRQELEMHMMKEERILFPLIRVLDSAEEPQAFHCGSVNNPISVMEHEHDQAGLALQQMRSLTADYAVPVGACGTYRAMLESLAGFEADLHQHIHKENNILFPRAAALEAQLAEQF